MSFDIDPRELDLQGADGMQLVRLLRRLIAEEGGGGGDEPVPSDVSDFFYCTYDVTTYSEIHNALTQNKIPVCPLDGHYYYLVSTTQSRYTFACYNNVNHSIICVRCASSGWDTVTFLPQEKLTWDYTPTQGSTNPVTSGGVYTAIKNNTVDPEDIQEAVDDWLDVHSSTIGGLSYEAKQALMDCFENVAWIDENGQDYYDALYDALFGTTPVTPTLESISAVFNQGSAVIYDDATLDSLRTYLTVTAHYSDSTSQVVANYQLAGTLTAGQSVITASYQGQLATFTVNVTARATLVSISAVFTQGSAVIYDTDSLDTLRQYLVVTANYSDSTTATVSDYTLSGTLTEGTSTITVSYGGKTDTFTVAVTASVIYTISNHVCDGTAATIVDTGVSLYTQDNDFTILIEVVTTRAQTKNWRILGDTGGSSGSESGAIIGKMSGSSNNTNLRYMAVYNEFTGFTSSTIGTAKFALRHTANSGTGIFDVKVNSGSPSRVTAQANFLTSNTRVFLGGNETGIRFFEGTISCTIYRTVLSDSEIASYLSGD